jgi:hypothetical protein
LWLESKCRVRHFYQFFLSASVAQSQPFPLRVPGDAQLKRMSLARHERVVKLLDSLPDYCGRYADLHA